MLRFVAFEPVVKATRLKSKVKNKWKAQRVHDLARRMKTAVAADLFSGLNSFKKSVPKKKLMEAWESGNYQDLDKHIPWETLPSHFEKTGESLSSAMLKASLMGRDHLPPPVKTMRWSLENPAIRGYVDNHVGSLIKDITEQGRDRVKRVIARSFQVAMTPKEVADRIVNHVGLHERYQIALDNYATKMQDVYARTGDFNVMNDRINEYADRLLNSRALAIARTELRQAANHGQRSMWREAARQGYIKRDEWVRVWVIDGAPCEECEPLDGEEAPIDGEYPSGLEPGEVHTNCECIEILEPKEEGDE